MKNLFNFAFSILFVFVYSLANAQNQSLQIQLTISHYVSYAGASDGAIDLTVTGGTPPYEYYWSNGETTEDISGLPEGFYYVRVYDNAGNAERDGINLTEPPPLQIELAAFEYPNGYNVSCYGCYNGFITVTVIGGTSPYTFQWEDGPTTQNRSSLGQGTYNLQVTDANGGGTEAGIILTEPQRDDWTMTGNANTDPAYQFIGTTDNKDLVIRTNGSERMRVKSNGDVKINSLSSAGNRMVYSDLNGVLKVANMPWMVYGNEINPPNEPEMFLGTTNAEDLVFKTDETERMRILSTGNIITGTGNVGIGVAVPYSKLQIGDRFTFYEGVPFATNPFIGYNIYYNNGYSRLFTNTNLSMIEFDYNGDITFKHDIAGTGAVNFDNKETVFYNDGRVAIGGAYAATAPEHFMLSVDGKIITTEVRVKNRNAWPDYVFEKDYEKLSIGEVEQFIKTNKHLPGIPSAKEVEQNGHNLGEMDALLLEKIEELTLYIIDLKKENDELKKKIESIK